MSTRQHIRLILWALLGWAIIALLVSLLLWGFAPVPTSLGLPRSNPDTNQRFSELIVWRGL